MIPYRCHLKRYSFLDRAAGTIARPTDSYRYEFVFELTPIEWVGQPDEAQHEETRRITVDATKSQSDLSNDNEVDRTLYWFALKALERGRDAAELDLDSPDAKVDLSRVVLPQVPFEVLLPGPVMGFHAPG